MAGKPRLSPDALAEWQLKLSAAAEDMHKLRENAMDAELRLRALINDAFDAGLSVTPICEATGMSLGRVYQIKRGTRR
jgi:hypothetical protein